MELENKRTLRDSQIFRNLSWKRTKSLTFLTIQTQTIAKKIPSLIARWIKVSFRNISYICVAHPQLCSILDVLKNIFFYDFFITTRYMEVNFGIQYSMYYTNKCYLLTNHNLYIYRATHFHTVRFKLCFYFITCELKGAQTIFSIYRWWINQRPSSCFFSLWKTKPVVRRTWNSTVRQNICHTVATFASLMLLVKPISVLVFISLLMNTVMQCNRASTCLIFQLFSQIQHLHKIENIFYCINCLHKQKFYNIFTSAMIVFSKNKFWRQFMFS